MSKILVTGASGFVGCNLLGDLASRGHSVIGTTRTSALSTRASDCELRVVEDITEPTAWPAVLGDVDCVVHLAARVHVMRERASDPLAEFRRVNVRGTQALAEAAADTGVRRLVYMSTVKVLGERTEERPLGNDDEPRPQDAYAVSKLEAEEAVLRIAARTGLEVVIIRPPLVYGPGVGGNFLRLMKWVNARAPLPFGCIQNKRSLVAVANLASFVRECLQHPGIIGKRLLVSDGQDVSTTELVKMMGVGLHRHVRLIPVPAPVLMAAGRILGRREEVSRLCESFRIDLASTQEALGWSPPVSTAEAVRITASWYRSCVGKP